MAVKVVTAAAVIMMVLPKKTPMVAAAALKVRVLPKTTLVAAAAAGALSPHHLSRLVTQWCFCYPRFKHLKMV